LKGPKESQNYENNVEKVDQYRGPHEPQKVKNLTFYSGNLKTNIKYILQRNT